MSFFFNNFEKKNHFLSISKVLFHNLFLKKPSLTNETQKLTFMPMGIHYALINLGEWKVTGCELRYRSEAATKGGRAPLPAPVSDDEGRARQSPTPFEGRGSHCRRSLTSLSHSVGCSWSEAPSRRKTFAKTLM